MTKTKWIIWSLEHQGWWKKNHTGYTQKKEEAGEYDYDEALRIVRGANIAGKDIPNEAMIMVGEPEFIDSRITDIECEILGDDIKRGFTSGILAGKDGRRVTWELFLNAWKA